MAGECRCLRQALRMLSGGASALVPPILWSLPSPLFTERRCEIHSWNKNEISDHVILSVIGNISQFTQNYTFLKSDFSASRTWVLSLNWISHGRWGCNLDSAETWPLFLLLVFLGTAQFAFCSIYFVCLSTCHPPIAHSVSAFGLS